MKINLFLIILFIFSSTVVFAQIAPRNSKAIKLNVGEGKLKDDLYFEVSKFLMEKGYEIGKSDKELGLIQTEERSVSYWLSRFSITVSDGFVLFRGKAINEIPGMNTRSLKDIENKGSLGNMYVKTWQDMDEFARSFPHNSVEYLK